MPRRGDLSCATGWHAAELLAVGAEARLGLPGGPDRYATELRDTDTGGDDMPGRSDRQATELHTDRDRVPGGYDGDASELRADQRPCLPDRSNRHTAELHADRDGLPCGYDGDASELHALGHGMSRQLHRQAAKLRMQCGLFGPELRAGCAVRAMADQKRGRQVRGSAVRWRNVRVRRL